ncbi:hypothetical protein D9756_010105 [Leucocoprinus leucothites]|uniref:Rab-GAP TBC domain-containing protein n=1 Tax=Leucocoprinus leucothites TaxID=201217 RepID=A0A8H5CR57_9AGAR|nr:hypothetical protein D9756_010105 [Leucoagaricus leucothites]
MDADQLVRWTRFAAKGGIGKCTAVNDYIAQHSDELMFLKGDEIVVLLRIPDAEDVYLGLCEGIIGRFRGQDVRFHGKLKRPVITKRSSLSAAAAKTPSPNINNSNSINPQDDNASTAAPPPLALIPPPPHPTLSVSASTTHQEPFVTTPPSALDIDRASRRSLGSDSSSSSRRSAESSQPSFHSSPPRHHSPQIVLNHDRSPPKSTLVVSPLNIIKKSPTTSPLHQTSFNVVTQEGEEGDLVDTHGNTHTRTEIPSPIIPVDVSDGLQPPPALNGGNDSDDGETGIGLSFLQSFGSRDSDDEDESFEEHANVGYAASFQPERDEEDDESTVEGLLYDDDPSGSDNPSIPKQLQQQQFPTPVPAQVNATVKTDDVASHVEDPSQIVTLPSRSSSPLSLSPTSPRSLASLSPPAGHQQFSIPSSRRPSLQSQQSQQSYSSWEGAGDIYDDYRYSRASILSGGTMATTRGRRSSAASSKTSATNRGEPGDGHVHDQHPPPPPPIPTPADSRPSIDSVFASGGDDTPLRRSVESKKSICSRKSAESTSHSSETRRSRQELLFPQPPCTVHIQHELLDQATRESLRRSSEASRILTQADFRLSVESEASIYSRLSVIEQEPPSTDSDASSPPLPPDSPVQTRTSATSERPTRLEIPGADQSPLLHTTWATPMASPSDPSFASMSVSTPTAMTPSTALLMPTAFASFTSGMASALREQVESTRNSEESLTENNQDGVADEGEGDESMDSTLRDIVVADEEDIPSGVVQETTFQTEYTHDTTMDMTQTTIVLPESVQAAARGDTHPRTPSPAPSPTKSDFLPNPFDKSPLSPTVPLQPLEVHSPPSTYEASEPPVSPTSPTSPTSPISPTSPTLSHLRPPRQAPTLADLREGGGDPIPGTNQRRSLFLPHPNAPKAPPASTHGPMYIAAQHHPQQVPPPFPPPPPIMPNIAVTEVGPPPMQKKSLVEVMQDAMYAPPSPAMRPRLMARGPTIYGQCEVELNVAVGPVPISFSVEPPPPPPVPAVPLYAHQHGHMPSHLGPGDRMMTPPPLHPNGGGNDGVQAQARRGPSPLPLARSVTSSPVMNGGAARSDGVDGGGEDLEGGVGDRGSLGEDNRPNGGVIPRANFFPKTPGQRPRSRSFSAFNSHSTKLEMPLPVSREEGAPQLVGQPTANDVRQSLRNSTRSSLRSSVSQGQLKLSPLRPSPLSLSPSLKPGPINNAPKPPPSPLAQSFRPPSMSASKQPQPSPSPTPSMSLQPPQQLRQITSRSTLNDAVLTGPMVAVTNPSEPSSPVVNSRTLPESINSRPSHEQPANETESVTNHSADSQSNSHSNSHFTPPSPVHHRHPSLRSKLSLPNLRRNRSRNDGIASPTVMEHDVSATVQVQDLDFELVRPKFQQQLARASEDSFVLGGRDGSMDVPGPREALFQQQRAASPAGSLNGPRSPTGEGNAWPRPSLQAAAAPILTRAGAETGSNMEAHRQRELKWMSLMASLAPSQWRKSKKVKKLLIEGVPSSVRYLIWQHLTDGKAKVVPGVYSQLGKRERRRVQAAERIEEDIGVWFKDQVHLQGKGGPVLALLQVYLTMVPDVQYTTGLTLIAGQLLLHAPEEDAFWIFVSMMDTHLRPYFSTSTIQMDVDASLFNRVVEQNDNQLAKKVYTDMGIEQSAVCAFWFSTLFASTLPPEYVNRVWDVFLFEGIPFLLRIGFAIMICCRRQILGATSPDVVLEYLHHPSPNWLPSTPDGFLSLAYSVKMKDDDVRKSRVKMEAQVKKQAQSLPRHLPAGTEISLPRT